MNVLYLRILQAALVYVNTLMIQGLLAERGGESEQPAGAVATQR